MYEYISGTIADVTPEYIVVDCNGVGYLIYVSNPYFYEGKDKVKVYVHHVVTDSMQALYGFSTFADKELYEKLLNVSGIGPKSALAIMAGNDNSGLINAINNEDDVFLTKFPGIGKKTAKQIILDLKDKIKTENTDIFEFKNIDTENKKLDDALEALKALGFTDANVKKISKNLSALGDLSTDQFISEGLKLLTN
ncbi:Holliday junction branch migration protein RuvA [Lactobacillus sp. S2-2]|uniref:Holliday junction branch migration protein RuvA n=1 Tax=Lactobacillus sp. S2-2 TaxID=2692917 RepID=UPI001F0029CE|nr:Holliday junction branch migration protein RuvA [Lactobacillus sp. S2-2]MCF6515805.1 Holliday junction branch migration protein RuvA [Lactobacillus sp. S2-2]